MVKKMHVDDQLAAANPPQARQSYPTLLGGPRAPCPDAQMGQTRNAQSGGESCSAISASRAVPATSLRGSRWSSW